jgi:hypothetical protein
MYRLVVWGTFAMALAAALGYMLMNAGVIHPGNLQSDIELPMGYILGFVYLVMGVLLLSRWRWIRIAEIVVIFITIIGFYTMYTDQPDVMWSAPGLITKIAQLLMLAGLIYLLVKTRPVKNSNVEAK